MPRLSRSLQFPPGTSTLAKRRRLEVAGWQCSADMPPNYHHAATQALKGLCEASGMSFSSYRLSKVFRASEDLTMEIMGRNTPFRDTYGNIASSRWGMTRSDKEITALAEQISPLRIPTPKQLWLLYGVIQGYAGCPAPRAADLMAGYLREVLLAQRERPASTRHIKHDMLEDDYLAVAALILRNGTVAANYQLPLVSAPVQAFNGVEFFIDDRPFPALRECLAAAVDATRYGAKTMVTSAVLEIVRAHV